MSNPPPPPPPPPGYGDQQPPASFGAEPVASPKNGLGTASLVLGILAILGAVFFIGLLFGVIGLVFGFIGRSRFKKGEATNGGVALAGIITSVVGILIGAAVVVFTVILVNSDDFENLTDCIDAANGDQAELDQCNDDFADDLIGG